MTDSKVYDGTTSSSGTVGTSGLVGGDTVTSLTQSYQSKNVLGTNGSTLQVNGGYVVNDGNGGNNYTVRPTPPGTITAAGLALNAVTDSKVYDGTTSSSGTVGTSGLVGGDTVTSLTQSYASKNVLGTNGSTLQVNGGYVVNDGNGGNNYTVATNTAAGTITAAGLALNAVTDSKVYDGTTSSSGTVGTSGLVGGDTVTSLTQSYQSKNVLGTNGSTLQVNGGYVVNDGNSGNNYTVATNTATGTITPLGLTGAAIAAGTSIYASALAPGAVSFGNVVAGDTVTGTASVNTTTLSSSNNPIVGSYTQTASTTLGGADAGNYSFAGFTSATQLQHHAAGARAQPAGAGQQGLRWHHHDHAQWNHADAFWRGFRRCGEPGLQ